MKKVSICIGTRPEAIKMAPIIKLFKKEKGIDMSVCVTGQHSEMVDQVLKIFDIVPDVDFKIMDKTNGLSEMSALLLKEFDSYFTEYKPDLVLAQGDTVSVFAAAVSAFYKKIVFGHVEAGLRTGNLNSPWPEEGFRCMVSPISSYHFAPTEESRQNLLREGVREEKVFVTGNTVIDTLFDALKILETIDENTLSLPVELRESKKKIVLITGHRRENFGEGLDNLCGAIKALASKHNDVLFVYPVHLNPQVQKQVQDMFRDVHFNNVLLIPPLGYLEFVWLMSRSCFIVTDSGGIQEEAPSLGKPVLVTRETTERPEGIVAGTIKLIGTSKQSIIDQCELLLSDTQAYSNMAHAKNPFGDGLAAGRIIDICKKI